MRSKYGLINNPILTPLHVEVCKTLFSNPEIAGSYFLTGGTALSAFYLQHRDSEDLDFFTHEEIHRGFVETVQGLFTKAGLVHKVMTRAPGFIRFQVADELKVDFALDSAFRFGIPQEIDGIRIDTEENIAINKVCTILGRLDAKDYVDLLFLIRDSKYDIFDLLKKGEKKDGGLEPFIWSQLIGDCETFSKLPRMRKELSLEELKQFYRDLRKNIVISLKPN